MTGVFVAQAVPLFVLPARLAGEPSAVRKVVATT
jgi:hypothetical protein